MTNLKKLTPIVATIIILSAGLLSWQIIVRKLTPEELQPQKPIAELRPSTPSPTYTNTEQEEEEEEEEMVEIQLKALPEKKVLEGGKHIYQTFNNCGPASLAMALSYYNVDVTQKELGNDLRPYQHPEGNNDDKNVTPIEIAKKAEEYNLIAFHRPAGDITLIENFVNYDIPVITKTRLKPNEDIGHYRVVKGFDSTIDEIIQDDSMQGKNLKYSYEEFNKLWEKFNYEFLVLVPKEKQEIVLKVLGDLAKEEQAWEKALQLASQKTEKDASNIYAKFNRSVALYYTTNYREAVTVYENIETELPPRTLWYQIEPILAYYQLGDYNKVLEISNRILNNQNRAFSELYTLQGSIYELRGEDRKAKDAFANAEKYNQNDYWKINLNDISN